MEQQQQLSILHDFVASLPPAAVKVLQLVYDSNTELTKHLERRNNEIRQLKLAYAAVLQQKDQQLEELSALVSRLQQQQGFNIAAAAIDQQEQGDLAAQDPTAPAQLASTASAKDLQAQHVGADGAAVRAKRQRSAHESEDQHAWVLDLQQSGSAHGDEEGLAATEPQHKRANTSTGHDGINGLAAGTASLHAQAAASQEGVPAAARSMRALSAGTLKLKGLGSSSLAKPAAQQQRPAPHPGVLAGPSILGPAGMSGNAGNAAAAGPADAHLGLQQAGQQSDDGMGAVAGGADADQDGADLLQFLAASCPSKQQHAECQEQQQRAASMEPSKSAQHPGNPAQPAEAFDAQEAYATIMQYLQQHGNAANNAVRGPSSAGGAKGPAGGGAAYAMGHSDGGSAASAFNPAHAAAASMPQLTGQQHGSSSRHFAPAAQGAAGRNGAATAGVAADLAAAAAAASRALGAGLPFGYSAPTHTQHPPAGYMPPHMQQDNPAAMQHILSSLGMHAGSAAAATGRLPPPEPYHGQRHMSAVAAGPPYGHAPAAAAPGGSGYGGYDGGMPAWEGWQQMQGMQRGMMHQHMGAAAPGMDQLPRLAPAGPTGRVSDGSVGFGSSMAAAGRRGSRGTKAAAAAAGDGDEQALSESSGESNWRREIERQIPQNVQDAICADWAAKSAPRELLVSCNDIEGTFFVHPDTKECFIRTAANHVVKPTLFERECGRGSNKDWQRSIRVPGYQGKNGPIRLGHFVRIVGISTSRRLSDR